MVVLYIEKEVEAMKEIEPKMEECYLLAIFLTKRQVVQTILKIWR